MSEFSVYSMSTEKLSTIEKLTLCLYLHDFNLAGLVTMKEWVYKISPLIYAEPDLESIFNKIILTKKVTKFHRNVKIIEFK
jgi:hypothetical protein